MGGAVNRKWCWMSKIPAGIGAGRKKECKTVVNDKYWKGNEVCCDECRKAKESY